MRARSVIKLIIGFLAVTTSSTARDLHLSVDYFNHLDSPCGSDLPLGCEGYELLQGNAIKSNNFFLLESHNACDTARVSCTTALLNQKFKNDNSLIKEKSTILFEEAEMNQAVVCKEYGLNTFVEDCQGWNRPAKERSDITTTYMAMNDLSNIIKPYFYSLHRLPNYKQKEKALSYLDDYISGVNKFLIQARKEQNKHPKNTHFIKSTGIKYNEYQLKHLKYLKATVKKAEKLSADIFQNFDKEFESISDKAKEYVSDEENYIRTPNQYLLNTIKNVARNNKTSVAYVGRFHMHKQSLAKYGYGQVALDAVDELYQGLNEFADENPYAVLNCKN